MSPKDWSTPSYTGEVDGISCGHDHTDIDRACRCVKGIMDRYKVPTGLVFQNQPKGGRLIRREVRQLTA